MTTNDDTPTPAPRGLTPLRLGLRWAELLALYWVLPFVIDFRERWQGRLLIPGMILGGVALFAFLWFDTRFDKNLYPPASPLTQ